MNWRDADGRLHEDVAYFHKVKESFGGLSNMAGGYPLRIGTIEVTSSEGLYQAMRFPHQPAWQQEIIEQASPMAAKMISRKEGRRGSTRADWERHQLAIMRWVLRVKLAQHFDRMKRLLDETGERAIVEKSHKDRFWGAVETGGELGGTNHLGRMWMELRTEVRGAPRERFLTVDPPDVADCFLLGGAIGRIGS